MMQVFAAAGGNSVSVTSGSQFCGDGVHHTRTPNEISVKENEVGRENCGRVNTVESFSVNAGKPSSHVDVRIAGVSVPGGDFVDPEMVDAGKITGVRATCREKVGVISVDAEFSSISAEKSS
jgi:hypothetical protein